MAEFFREFNRFRGGSILWLGNNPASVLAQNEFFGVPAVGGDTVYIGAGNRATRYVGNRLDADLYLGAGTLWP